MTPTQRERFLSRYAFAIVVAGLAVPLTHWVKFLSETTLNDIFLGAVLLSAWYGGFGPGILTAALSILILDYFFIPPLYTFRLHGADLIRLFIFGSVTLLTSALNDRMKRAEELSRMNQELKGEIAQRMEAEKTILEISGREQQRLSEDLHDGLCQELAGIKLLSEGVKEKLAARAAAEAQEVELIESRLGAALFQADNISRGLYPVELETHGLMAAMQELAEKIPRIYPVTCRFVCVTPVLVHDATVATHLYRIAQEAAVNAIKNGKAKRIVIRLRTFKSRGVLSIADDGSGFQTQKPRQGMGLKMMNYRARLIGALFDIRSRAGRGTMVRITFRAHL